MDTKTSSRAWLDLILVAGAGFILGAFCGRVLAELPQVTWPTYRWWLSLLLALLGSACFASIWMLVAFVVAVRQALDYKSTGRAIVVCLIGFVVYMVLMFSIAVVTGVGAGIMGAMTS